MNDLRADGLVIGPTQAYSGEPIYVEIMPSTPYRLKNGRSWKESHVRWWYEVFYLDKKKDPHFKQRMWTHAIEHDGGGITLRQTISKSIIAMQKLAEELEKAD